MHTNSRIRFPKTFAWGAASASYQIEGAAAEGGKDRSVWDMFCRRPGKVWEGQVGDDACDQYHRFAEDAGLMRDIGLNAYRFSISWPRVLPDEAGRLNNAGLDYYDRLVDALLAAGVTPWITLYHWDLPRSLYLRGGWMNREIVRWFSDYATAVTERLSDRVQNWITFNEPQVFVGLGLETGRHAPGDKLGLPELLQASHHVLLAHGLAVQAIRAGAKTAPTIGWAPVSAIAYPVSNSEGDIAAARRAMFEHACRPLLVAPGDDTQVWSNTWWSDPVVLGGYPEDAVKAFGAAMPQIAGGDMETICQPLDFLGGNVYHGTPVKRGANGEPERVPRPMGYPLTSFNWPVCPECIYWAPKFLQERYQLPFVVTENGVSCRDWISLDGAVHDPQRIDFHARYLAELARAIRDGVDVRGYFAWSVMDNFEWAEGVKERFGLIHVDYRTQQRTIKDSGHWYRELIQSGGANLPEQGAL